MYELSILGALMSRDMSGYKLRQVLGSNLVPRREISNGVMYPVLQQLQHKEYITMSLAENSPRHEKVAHITDIGQKHFYALMAAPVPVDAKRESVYLFKFRSLAAVDFAEQLQILTEYENVNDQDLNVYTTLKKHLQQHTKPGKSDPALLKSTINTLELNIALCQTKKQWVAQTRTRIVQQQTTEGGMHHA